MEVKLGRAFSDEPRFGKSVRLASPASDTYAVFKLVNKTFVKDVWLKVDTAYTALSTGQLSVGFVDGSTTDTDGFLTTVGADALNTGLKRASIGSADYAAGYYFESPGGLITVTTDIGTSTTDVVIWLFVEYYVIW